MSALETRLVSAVSGTGVQSSTTLDKGSRDEAILQLEFTAAGSVTVEGRIGSDYSWLAITPAYTANTIIPIAYVPYMRLNIASNSGLITAGVVVR